MGLIGHASLKWHKRYIQFNSFNRWASRESLTGYEYILERNIITGTLCSKVWNFSPKSLRRICCVAVLSPVYILRSQFLPAVLTTLTCVDHPASRYDLPFEYQSAKKTFKFKWHHTHKRIKNFITTRTGFTIVKIEMKTEFLHRYGIQRIKLSLTLFETGNCEERFI